MDYVFLEEFQDGFQDLSGALISGVSNNEEELVKVPEEREKRGPSDLDIEVRKETQVKISEENSDVEPEGNLESRSNVLLLTEDSDDEDLASVDSPTQYDLDSDDLDSDDEVPSDEQIKDELEKLEKKKKKKKMIIGCIICGIIGIIIFIAILLLIRDNDKPVGLIEDVANNKYLSMNTEELLNNLME